MVLCAYPLNFRVLVLPANSTQPSNCSLFKHLPNLIHGKEVPFKGVLKFHGFSSTWIASIPLGLESELSFPLPISKSHYGLDCRKSSTTSTLGVGDYLLRLLRKLIIPSFSLAVRLILHGFVGVAINLFFYNLVTDLSRIRVMETKLESFISDNDCVSNSKRIWLLQLFFLLSSHVRNGLRPVRISLRYEGSITYLLFFLGSWPAWQKLVLNFLLKKSMLLPFYPLPSQIGICFLSSLKAKFLIPLISLSYLYKYFLQLKNQYSPILFTLHLTHTTNILESSQILASLPEEESLQIGLINLLRILS